jgi:hypothetical protein
MDGLKLSFDTEKSIGSVLNDSLALAFPHIPAWLRELSTAQAGDRGREGCCTYSISLMYALNQTECAIDMLFCCGHVVLAPCRWSCVSGSVWDDFH